MITVTAESADRTTPVRPGEEIAVSLSENRTAGYQWTVESLTGELTVVSSEFAPPADDRPGAGGRRAIVLRAGGPGAGELVVRYQRPWDSDTAAARRCRFVFAVRSA